MFKRILLGVLILLLVWLAWEWFTWPDVARLAKEMPKSTAFMDLRREQLRAEGKDDRILYSPVPYGQISPYLRRAVLVAEDDEFYHHDGVDMKGIQEAIEKDWKRKKLTHGGSTITQQLAKNLWLSPSRNPVRKLKEYFLARSLERHLTKKRILEIYLNVVEMGERVYGAQAASHFYFGASSSSLSPQQAALLAGCLPNPRLMSPDHPNKRLRFRQKMILARMRRWGYLFEKEVLAEKKPEATPVAPTETTDTDLVVTPSDSEGPGGEGGTTTSTTETTDTVAPTTTETTDTAPPP